MWLSAGRLEEVQVQHYEDPLTWTALGDMPLQRVGSEQAPATARRPPAVLRTPCPQCACQQGFGRAQGSHVLLPRDARPLAFLV